jgi:hypothetical protein
VKFVAVLLVRLIGPQGGEIYVNPAEVSSLREPGEISGHWTAGTHCILVMTNGKFNGVGEECDVVRRVLGAPCNCGNVR